MATNPTQSAKIKNLETKLHIETSLRQIQNKVHQAELDEIMIQVKEELRRLLGCERVTIFLKDQVRGDIVSKSKDGRPYGVIQCMNTQDGMPFNYDQERIVTEFATALAISCANKFRINIR